MMDVGSVNGVPLHPFCYGYLDNVDACSCYSGYYTNSYLKQCYESSPDYCYVNGSSKLNNDVVPFVNWWEPQVNGNRLSLSIYSEMVAWRRTYIELPNSQCNFVNSPQYYRKDVNGCLDRFVMDFPFIECGFVKTSTSLEDIYKGTIHVKQMDMIEVGGVYQYRVIDTPFPVSIRMPKTLAVSTT